jgi:hypothetical protein
MKEDTDKTWMEVHGGYTRDMTLRDYYAGLAITGLSLHDVPSEEAMRVVVNDAYRLADAMLKARDAK